MELTKGAGLASAGREAVARGRNFDALAVTLTLVLWQTVLRQKKLIIQKSLLIVCCAQFSELEVDGGGVGFAREVELLPGMNVGRAFPLGVC